MRNCNEVSEKPELKFYSRLISLKYKHLCKVHKNLFLISKFK